MGGYPYPLPGVNREVQAGFGLAPTRVGRVTCPVVRRLAPAHQARPGPPSRLGIERFIVGSVIKKRRKRMAKKKHRKLLKRTRIQRRRAGK